jgi:chromosome segregation ATPase
LRDELERTIVVRETEVQATMVASQHEVAMLKATVTALRDELEAALGERDTAIQNATLNLAHEIAQVRETVRVLRTQIDQSSSPKGRTSSTR